MSWSRPFDEPIPLPRGRQIVTLKDAATYIQQLPKAEQDLEEWQTAVEALLRVVELNGPTIMARIGVMRALNRGHVREFDSSRKDTHWGQRGTTEPVRCEICQRTCGWSRSRKRAASIVASYFPLAVSKKKA